MQKHNRVNGNVRGGEEERMGWTYSLLWTCSFLVPFLNELRQIKVYSSFCIVRSLFKFKMSLVNLLFQLEVPL